MTTLKLLTERIRLILSGGYPSASDRVQDNAISHAIISACGRQLALSSLSVNYNMDGAGIPDGAMVATYYNRPVIRGNGSYCRVALPAVPMNMPERIGVFAIYPSGRPEEAFMFIPPALLNVWKGNKVLNPIDTIMFTWENKYADVYSDLIGAGIHEVDMKLCVADIAQQGDYDPLPISPDMELQVIEDVLKIFGLEPLTDRKEGREASPERGA